MGRAVLQAFRALPWSTRNVCQCLAEAAACTTSQQAGLGLHHARSASKKATEVPETDDVHFEEASEAAVPAYDAKILSEMTSKCRHSATCFSSQSLVGCDGEPAGFCSC